MTGQVSNPTKATQSEACQVTAPDSSPHQAAGTNRLQILGKEGKGGKSGLHSKSGEGGRKLERPGGQGLVSWGDFYTFSHPIHPPDLNMTPEEPNPRPCTGGCVALGKSKGDPVLTALLCPAGTHLRATKCDTQTMGRLLAQGTSALYICLAGYVCCFMYPMTQPTMDSHS